MSNDYDVTQGLGTGPDQVTTALVPVHLCTGHWFQLALWRDAFKHPTHLQIQQQTLTS